MIRQKNFEEYFKHNLKLYIFFKTTRFKKRYGKLCYIFICNKWSYELNTDRNCKNLSAYSLNATKQQTNLQNKNDTVVSDDEVPIPTSELCSVIKNESILKI